METDFENLITSFIETNIGISESFLSAALANNLKANLLLLERDNLLAAAATGHSKTLQHNLNTRSDRIYWLDRDHNNIYENEFFDLVEDFVEFLNRSCYAGITSYEFHYSLYAPGAFYSKHRDQFLNNSGRKYSMISYLNANWQKEDGGELVIQQSETNQSISPTQGKTVFFKSNELIHEVLKTNQPRLSITGWLKG
ncbi:proline hydroxylase [Sphingobacteriaceae bacterium]|nr:proline hydroxylase [Sphingobacteriaceae bacterium]